MKDILGSVRKYLNKYKEDIKVEYKVKEEFGRKKLEVIYKNVENINTLNGFMNYDVDEFGETIKKLFENVLFKNKESESCSFNLYHIQINKKNITIYPDVTEDVESIFIWNTKEIYELILEYCKTHINKKKI